MSSNLKISTLFDVEGLVAVVTGGGTGIGAMIAKSLAANGASAVYILGLRIGPLEEVAKEAVRTWTFSPHQCIL
jgi:NAD(P)-dependent dehydrogenase (short-subunit alcohol dehydrogenase family)